MPSGQRRGVAYVSPFRLPLLGKSVCRCDGSLALSGSMHLRPDLHFCQCVWPGKRSRSFREPKIGSPKRYRSGFRRFADPGFRRRCAHRRYPGNASLPRSGFGHGIRSGACGTLDHPSGWLAGFRFGTVPQGKPPSMVGRHEGSERSLSLHSVTAIWHWRGSSTQPAAEPRVLGHRPVRLGHRGSQATMSAAQSDGGLNRISIGRRPGRSSRGAPRSPHRPAGSAEFQLPPRGLATGSGIGRAASGRAHLDETVPIAAFTT